MDALDIARRLVELGEVEEAVKAYELVINNKFEISDLEKFEIAYYILNNGGDYKISYTIFLDLFNKGLYQNEIFDILVYAFYEPNIESIKKKYNLNCKLLKKYPYMLKNDYLDFDCLEIKFFPYDEEGYIPFYPKENKFGDYFNPNKTVIEHYFFKDLSKPILANNIYSQYELEYLKDNVRKSEWVGYENHIYLYYDNVSEFLAYLQVLDMKELIKDEKFILLFDNQKEKYPIDFKSEFGVDYSKYLLKPIGIREVNKLIWHTQLSTHNGGDFFNEIIHGHPNVLAFDSLGFEDLDKDFNQYINDHMKTYYKNQLKCSKRTSAKDKLVACFLDICCEDKNYNIDVASRIAPAIMLQPHFPNIHYDLYSDDKYAITISNDYNSLKSSEYFTEFKYVKTFTPLRRPTTSYAATVKFKLNEKANIESEKTISYETMSLYLKNKSFMINVKDRLYQDSRLVRFEDGKLNPKATFMALAAFLDVPYTETMTYCSNRTGINPISMEGNAVGFDASTVYKTYDEYANDEERSYLEYFMWDVYENYGYDFKYYKNDLIMENDIEKIDKNFTKIPPAKEDLIKVEGKIIREGSQKVDVVDLDVKFMEGLIKERKRVMKILLKKPTFVNEEGQPLVFMKKLELDDNLLETELYR